MKLSIITFLSILFFIATANLSFSQRKKNALDTVFYSKKEGRVVKTYQEATYFEIVKRNGKIITTQEFENPNRSIEYSDTTYYAFGEIGVKPRENAEYYILYGKNEEVWERRRYYINGNLLSKQSYSDSEYKIPTGLVYDYHENGKLRKVYTPNKDEREIIYVQVYSEEGDSLLRDGNTFIEDEGKMYLYENYKLIEVYTVEENGQKLYTITKKQAEPKEGFEKYYQYIGNTLTYPKEAKRMGIQGRVYIQFIIDKTGKIQDAKVIKGIGGGCDEEALTTVQSYKEWIAGENHKGEKVAIKINIPIVFRLDN